MNTRILGLFAIAGFTRSSSAVSPTKAPEESVTMPPPAPCFRVDSHPASQRAGAAETTAAAQEAFMSPVGCEDEPIARPVNLKSSRL